MALVLLGTSQAAELQPNENVPNEGAHTDGGRVSATSVAGRCYAMHKHAYSVCAQVRTDVTQSVVSICKIMPIIMQDRVDPLWQSMPYFVFPPNRSYSPFFF